MSKKFLVSVCAFLMTVMVGYSQTVTVTGKVIDEKNAPVAGASVVEKSTKKGQSVGADGSFTISVKKGATLVVSALGYEGTEVPVVGSTLTIVLTSEVKALADGSEGEDDLVILVPVSPPPPMSCSLLAIAAIARALTSSPMFAFWPCVVSVSTTEPASPS